jgi:hypothetical protein
MSAFGKHGVRCDWCGKISTNLRGEYVRPIRNQWGVQLAGYIAMRKIGGEDLGHDICQECNANLCPFRNYSLDESRYRPLWGRLSRQQEDRERDDPDDNQSRHEPKEGGLPLFVD